MFCNFPGQPPPSTDVQAAISVLKRCREVTADVSIKWKISADYRLKTLYGEARKSRTSQPTVKSSKSKGNPDPNEENKTTVLMGHYLNEFKVLKSPQGYQLVSFRRLSNRPAGCRYFFPL